MDTKFCSVDGCNSIVKCAGYCSSHYMRWWRYGNPLVPLKKSKNGSGWITKDGYKLFTLDGKGVREHRYFIEKEIGRKLRLDEHVHHINGDRTDNRLSNLQLMSIKEHCSLEGKKARGIPKISLRKVPPVYTCLWCGLPFIIKESQFKRKYCSRKCYWKSKKGVKWNVNRRNAQKVLINR